jgi:hypothetical protein
MPTPTPSLAGLDADNALLVRVYVINYVGYVKRPDMTSLRFAAMDAYDQMSSHGRARCQQWQRRYMAQEASDGR